ncbi:hypothetical protein [Nesterenkonia alkaliphila]|uniref:Uncharacterized protein n=1 Tax=Nesterenkonia alkaliphila TaxID=1463631 RepID=A0A7K1UJI6_9MICC|nr:hypothetical protein [Nesterenkonia alkaliphila]MVT26576.1 hypothetical protein [Nesterenkonia alkaliphila]GFZ78770.1 hypothetical protein GCM10011359_03900 [Nesterenkonia alkaliphila]
MRELIRHGSAAQLLLRAVIALAGLGFTALLTVISERGVADFWTALAPAALSLAAALWPQNLAPLGMLAYSVVAWVAVNDDVRTAWTLPAAALLLILHTGAAAAAVLPVAASVPAQLWIRWTGRAAAVMVVTILAWMLMRAVSGLLIPGAALILLAATLLAGAAALAHDRWARAQAG